MNLSIIAAFSENRVIGLNNQMPWSLPEDLKRFRQLTWGKPIIMGRKTFDSIGRPLAGRTNVVITRQKNLQIKSCSLYSNLAVAIKEQCENNQELMIVGGAELYDQCLPLANKLYLTLIHANFHGDTFFPEFNENDWREVERQEGPANTGRNFDHHYVVLERIVS